MTCRRQEKSATRMARIWKSPTVAFDLLLVYALISATFLLQPSEVDALEVNGVGDGTSALGHTAVLICQSNDTSVTSLTWSFQDIVLSNGTQKSNSSWVHEAQHTIQNVSFDNFGKYTCTAALDGGKVVNATYELLFAVFATVSLKPVHEVKEGNNVSMICTAIGYPSASTIHWQFGNRPVFNSDKYHMLDTKKNEGEISSSLTAINASIAMNGTYSCYTPDGNNETQLVVKSKPRVRFSLIKAVGRSTIYCNWTLFTGNSKIKSLELKFFQGKTKSSHTLMQKENYFLIPNLKPNEPYFNFSLLATNEIGSDEDLWSQSQSVTTLSEEPRFTPTVSVNGVTSNTVTLGWRDLPNVTEYFDYYNVTVRSRSGHISNSISYENPVMVEKLKSGAAYTFKVQACSSYIKKCDDYSHEVNGTTMDGVPSPPMNLRMQCHYDSTTHETFVNATWEEPSDPQGSLSEYDVTLTGNASYYNEDGHPAEDKVGPVTKTVLAHKALRVEFPSQLPNTHLFLSVCAKTGSKQCSMPAKSSCVTPKSIPDEQELSRTSWKAVQRTEGKQIYFLVSLPHLSQRNGSICCLRVVVVRMTKDQSVDDLKPPREMEIRSYAEVHKDGNSGAYVAEMLDATSRNVMIGDGSSDNLQPCDKCGSQLDDDPNLSSYRPADHYNPLFNTIPSGKQHKKRHTNSNSKNSIQHSNVPFTTPVDGELDAESTYTAYVDAIVINDNNERVRAQSSYLKPLKPKRINNYEPIIPGVAVVSSLVVALIVVLIALMCVMRWRSKEPGDQEYGLSHSIQQWCRRLRGQQPIPSEEPPNLPSICKDDLVPAYVDRHKDSDLGFQQEFEKLPDRFCDRTSQGSDSPCNSGKNRYPDIKAYDQTRVKLSVSENGTDYINANFVVGYKERKKFICAQGPMEVTVFDWWKMIWEQHVHFILMLTNVEEYNKTKCAKYWPSEGSTNYADFTVSPTSEKRYSDYLVRNLKLTKMRNGVGSGDDGNKEEREIAQYHYLVWKDFMAPEHPVGILRFIKRFNETYTPDKGPILVHCSAGVGRTGTLVALDSLLQQLNEESCVSIFNTICDLRHQRNYLVQSLKQYIFIYRALMEMSQFGDTEILTSDLKGHIEKLKSGDDTRIRDEFERRLQVIEDRKPFTVGASEENKHRNRHENIIPYDRNRVHLSPMPSPTKEINTYINATFVEGYDNTEQFIISQDPLEATIGDFWRMIVEQNIRSIVMLSETGEEKCPRYWPEKDQETTHDYIKVKYMQSQSFPFYYRREFTVTDTKTDNSCLVTQFQYNGWPVGEGEVPQIDRGIVELIDTTFKYKETLQGNIGPIVVHCSDGADRSCIFVALAILAQQMLIESRVDVFSVVRKLRSQRQGLFRNFQQYEFIYRGLFTHAELHVANGSAAH